MQYDKEFKLQALELSDEIGVKAAADQLGIKYYTLADWRRQRKARGEDKTPPRLIQFHTFKNAVNPPFLGGFSVFGTVAA